MSVYNLLVLRWHGRFYTGVISQWYQQWVSKGILGLRIPQIGRVITIWDELFWKLRVWFDGLLSCNKVFYESSHRIETHIYVLLEVLELKISVYFELCLDEEFIQFWWASIMFESPYATIFVEFPPSNGGAFFVSGTTLLGYWAFGESFLSG